MSTQIAEVGQLGSGVCGPFRMVQEKDGGNWCDWNVNEVEDRKRNRRLAIAGAAVGVGLVAWIAWLALRRRPPRLQGLGRRRRRR